MASTAEPPTEPPSEREEPPDEMSPLLGREFARQPPGEVIIKNFFYGTGWLVQIATMIVILLVAVPIFKNKIILFSGHPLSQLIGFFAIVQSILVLQPTHLPEQKHQGRWVHAALHFVSLGAFVSGVTIIEYNKIHNGLEHFHSSHAYIGVATLVVLAIQYIFGITMWAVSALYGGEDNAKRMWKYHRWSGYLVLLLLIASIISATETDYVESVLKTRTLFVSLVCAVVFLAIFPQISQKKLGLRKEGQ